MEEINQKILAKEGIVKKYQDRVKQYKQNKTFQIMKENSTKSKKNAQGQINNQKQRK